MIELKPGTAPITSRPYRTNSVVSHQMDRIFDSYLAAGLIEYSISQWSSSLVFIPKEDDLIRITGVYKRLNAGITVVKWPLPRIDEVFEFTR